MSNRKKIAVIGSGISGLSTAYFLKQTHEVHLFEKLDRIGGHSNTVQVDMKGQTIPIDTGFIVFNRFTYPNLVKFFEHLNIPVLESNMSFSVSLDHGRFEYAGTNLSTLFCQPMNFVNIDFWRMLKDISRFNRMAHKASQTVSDQTSLEEFLNEHSFSQAFRKWYLYPMASAIWSMPLDNTGAYPARTLINFFHNHGLLRAISQYPWLTVKGGSCRYVNKIISQINNIHINTEIKSIKPCNNTVEVISNKGTSVFDAVVLATDCASPLSLIHNPSQPQKDILRGFKVSLNKAILHWDKNLMPKRKKAWASWNYLLRSSEVSEGVSLSYWMNRLQNLESEHPLIVSLNPIHEPNPKTVLYETDYVHPLFDAEAVKMQQRLCEIQGLDNIWFAGAYCGYGFHEDGLKSAMDVAQALGGKIPWKN